MPSTVGTERVRALYSLMETLPRFNHQTALEALPTDGIYLFFERGEFVSLDGRAASRIVRVGTHRVDGRFRKRIRQHYGGIRALGGNRNGLPMRP